MPTHTSKTIPYNLELYKLRAKNVDLIWCQQIVSMLDEYDQGEFSINDIGCNYGQFYKELKRRGFTDRVDYRGFDIDSKFLEIGKRYFPEISDKFIELDIESSVPPNSDIIICSACFEHLEKPYDALDNMLGSASKFIYLRTFVGTSAIEQIQSDTEFVSIPYNINQFNLFELSQFFFKKGFNFSCIPDLATNNSKEYELYPNSGIFRRMYIIKGVKVI